MAGNRRTSYPWMNDPDGRQGRLRRLHNRFRAMSRGTSRRALGSWAGTLLAAGVVFVAVFLGITRASEISGFVQDRAARAQAAQSPAQARIYYPNCAAAEAAGQGPMFRTHRGYREALDADLDGWACEPYPRG